MERSIYFENAPYHILKVWAISNSETYMAQSSLGREFWPNIWFVPENVPCTSEKNVYSAVVERCVL